MKQVPNDQPNPAETPVQVVVPPVPLTLNVLARFDVYARALDLAGLVGGISVRAHLRTQMVKAAESIVLNIAEGQGRTAGDRLASFERARGSLYEVAAALDLAARPHGETPRIAESRGYVRAIAAMLAKLCRR